MADQLQAAVISDGGGGDGVGPSNQSGNLVLLEKKKKRSNFWKALACELENRECSKLYFVYR